MSVEDSDMWCMQDSTRAFPSFIPYPIQQAGSYEGYRPRKTAGGTDGFSVAETISLCSLRAVGLWFSRIRGWSSRAMHAHVDESGDIDRDKDSYPNAETQSYSTPQTHSNRSAVNQSRV